MSIDILLKGATISVGKDEDFFINEDNVDGELCQAGRLLSFYGTLAVDLKTQLADAESQLELYEATLSKNLRAILKGKGEKMTEGAIKEQILTDDKRIDLFSKVLKFQNDYLKVENLFRSQQKKTDCLISLAYKQRTEIQKAY